MVDNTALAQFIASFGSLNGYGSTVAQTKRALDTGNTNALEQDNEDVPIFKDALAGIKAVKKDGFTVDGIININKSFVYSKEEDPAIPGHLRNSMYNSDDNIAITIDTAGKDHYFPSEVVYKADLQKIIDEFKHSAQTKQDAWLVFAKLAKLQPFQDGNKRTALIAANAAYNVWEKENYLVLPFNELDRAEFTINLMRFYGATDHSAENKAFSKMLELLPNDNEQIYHKHINEQKALNPKTVKLKPLFRNGHKEMRR